MDNPNIALIAPATESCTVLSAAPHHSQDDGRRKSPRSRNDRYRLVVRFHTDFFVQRKVKSTLSPIVTLPWRITQSV
jgi:hypothetical protein